MTRAIACKHGFKRIQKPSQPTRSPPRMDIQHAKLKHRAAAVFWKNVFQCVAMFSGSPLGRRTKNFVVTREAISHKASLLSFQLPWVGYGWLVLGGPRDFKEFHGQKQEVRTQFQARFRVQSIQMCLSRPSGNQPSNSDIVLTHPDTSFMPNVQPCLLVNIHQLHLKQLHAS